MTTPPKGKAIARGIFLRGRIYWLRFRTGGRRIFVSLETSDPIEALRRAAEIRRTPMGDGPTPFAAAVERFLDEKRRFNLFSRATERVHGAALREFGAAIEGRPIGEVSEASALAHYARLQARVAETTAQIHIRALRAFFAWGVKAGLAVSNPFAKLRLRRIDQPARVRFCTRQQRDSLIEAATNDDLRFILFAGFDTGFRKNEIIEARAGWFDLAGRAVHLQNTPTFRLKDRDARAVPLTGKFCEFLHGYLAGKAPDAFALRPDVKHGRGTYRYDFHRPYNDLMVAQGCRWVTAHVMRHTFASLLVQAGVSIYKVARWMGDGVEVVQAHYGHLAPGDSDIERIR